MLPLASTEIRFLASCKANPRAPLQLCLRSDRQGPTGHGFGARDPTKTPNPVDQSIGLRLKGKLKPESPILSWEKPHFKNFIMGKSWKIDVRSYQCSLFDQSRRPPSSSPRTGAKHEAHLLRSTPATSHLTPVSLGKSSCLSTA